ncbi:hypothetical protein BV20DRAFT_1052033 [Pilatotrama ljubarskyi]|nr:hypothetical protein BV20DRAFT_1052033 [Pilatotrama ljubarskyi]
MDAFFVIAAPVPAEDPASSEMDIFADEDRLSTAGTHGSGILALSFFATALPHPLPLRTPSRMDAAHTRSSSIIYHLASVPASRQLFFPPAIPFLSRLGFPSGFTQQQHTCSIPPHIDQHTAYHSSLFGHRHPPR